MAKVNTVSETGSEVSARWQTLKETKADLTNHADWYAANGTGRINRVRIKANPKGEITIKTKEVYRN